MRRFSTPAVILVAGTVFVAGCGSGKNVQNPRTQLDFGVKAARISLWREARFRFEKAVALDPNNAEALNDLAVAYEGTGEFEKAKTTYLRALQLDRSNRFIQKNYSRFTEFYSRSERRQGAPKQTPSPAARPGSVPTAPQPAATPGPTSSPTPAATPQSTATPVAVPSPTPRTSPVPLPSPSPQGRS
ncbi:MAG: tetratricopeptide repeat protein [Acidobacteriota bacterium]